ncbi:MAG: phospholipid scramblase-related protein [Bacteroidia bacterium]|nr:phospholipid scramblase-related protein [Bacteroidia bacterium]
MSSPFSSFFETDTYFIDEKVNMFKFQNEYKVYNELAVQIGMIRQQLSTGEKILRLLINKAMMPFHFEITDAEGVLQASLKRGWTFWMSQIEILDGAGTVIGTIKQQFKLFKPTFHISDASGTPVASITGDWIAWNFTILNAQQEQIGTITKKWAGMAKELFTTADKYQVNIHPSVKEDVHKVAIVAAAITVDMVFKEQK